jgi:hypothetical protein
VAYFKIVVQNSQARPSPENEGSTSLRNVGSYLHVHKALQQRIPASTTLFLCQLTGGKTIKYESNVPSRPVQTSLPPSHSPLQPQQIIQRVLMIYETNTCYCLDYGGLFQFTNKDDCRIVYCS